MQNKELKNQINRWALNQLASLRFSVADSDVESILDTPWSYVANIVINRICYFAKYND